MTLILFFLSGNQKGLSLWFQWCITLKCESPLRHLKVMGWVSGWCDYRVSSLALLLWCVLFKTLIIWRIIIATQIQILIWIIYGDFCIKLVSHLHNMTHYQASNLKIFGTQQRPIFHKDISICVLEAYLGKMVSKMYWATWHYTCIKTLTSLQQACLAMTHTTLV